MRGGTVRTEFQSLQGKPNTDAWSTVESLPTNCGGGEEAFHGGADILRAGSCGGDQRRRALVSSSEEEEGV